MNERLLSLVVDCGPIHIGDNRSRHSPVMVKLNLGAIKLKKPALIKSTKKPAWYKANEQQLPAYTGELDRSLGSLSIPASVHCLDINCSDASHSCERDSLVLDMLIKIIEVSHAQIPLVGGSLRKSNKRRGSGSIPGWTETVEPYGKDAIFWLAI